MIALVSLCRRILFKTFGIDCMKGIISSVFFSRNFSFTFVK